MAEEVRAPLLGSNPPRAKDGRSGDHDDKKRYGSSPASGRPPSMGAPTGGASAATLSDAAFAVIRSVVGPAALYLPHGVATAGVSASVVITVLSYLLFVAGTARLISCWRWHLRYFPREAGRPLAGYPEVARDLAGKRAEKVVQFGIISLQLGVCVTYFIFVSSNIQSVLQLLFGGPKVHLTYLILSMALIELPLCCIRDIHRLAPTNRVANVLVGFSLILIVVYSSAHLAHNGVAAGVEPGIVGVWDSLLFVGTCLFAFEGAATLTIPVGNSLRPDDRKEYFTVYLRTVFCIAVVYLGFSLVCYLSYGPDVTVIITLSLDDNIFPGATIRLVYSVAVVLSFPLQAFPVLDEVSRALRVRAQRWDSATMQGIADGNGWRCLLVSLIAVVAVVGENSLDHIVALLGSISSAPIALIIPPLMHRTVLARSSLTSIDNQAAGVEQARREETAVASPFQAAQQGDGVGGAPAAGTLLTGGGGVGGGEDADGEGGQGSALERFPPSEEQHRHFITPWDRSEEAARHVDVFMGTTGVLITVLTTAMTLATWNAASSR